MQPKDSLDGSHTTSRAHHVNGRGRNLLPAIIICSGAMILRRNKTFAKCLIEPEPQDSWPSFCSDCNSSTLPRQSFDFYLPGAFVRCLPSFRHTTVPLLTGRRADCRNTTAGKESADPRWRLTCDLGAAGPTNSRQHGSYTAKSAG
jgi:hypothetical protein